MQRRGAVYALDTETLKLVRVSKYLPRISETEGIIASDGVCWLRTAACDGKMTAVTLKQD